MLAFDEHLSIAEFELRLGDAIDNPAVPLDEKATFQELATMLRSARRSDTVIVSPRSIILIQHKRIQ